MKLIKIFIILFIMGFALNSCASLATKNPAKKTTTTKKRKATKKKKAKKSNPDVIAETTILESSKYIAKLGVKWNSEAFKYISIDGDRHTFGIINDVIGESNVNSKFFLNSKGELLIRLNGDFEMKLVFYPPNTKNHQKFNIFTVQIINKDRKTVFKQKINNRLKKYEIIDQKWQ